MLLDNDVIYKIQRMYAYTFLLINIVLQTKVSERQKYASMSLLLCYTVLLYTVLSETQNSIENKKII